MKRITLGVSTLALALGAGPAVAAANVPDTASLTQSQQVSSDNRINLDVPVNGLLNKSVNGSVRQEGNGRTSIKVEGKVRARVRADGKVKARVRADGKVKARVRADGKVKARVRADGKVKARVRANAKVKARVRAESKCKTPIKTRSNVKARVRADRKLEARVRAKSKNPCKEARPGGWVDNHRYPRNSFLTGWDSRKKGGLGRKEDGLGRKRGPGGNVNALGTTRQKNVSDPIKLLTDESWKEHVWHGNKAKVSHKAKRNQTQRLHYRDLSLGSDPRHGDVLAAGCKDGRPRGGIDELRGAAICPVAAIQMQQPLLAGGLAFAGGLLCLAIGAALRRRLNL